MAVSAAAVTAKLVALTLSDWNGPVSYTHLIGAKEITDYSLVTYGQGELVYFIVKPTNISVLSLSLIHI